MERYRQAAKPVLDKIESLMSSSYRAIIGKPFPNSRIIAERFHVIRLINHHFLGCWKSLDPVGGKNRRLLSLMRRHAHNLEPEQKEKVAGYLKSFPALEPKRRTRKQCQLLAPQLLQMIQDLN